MSRYRIDISAVVSRDDEHITYKGPWLVVDARSLDEALGRARLEMVSRLEPGQRLSAFAPWFYELGDDGEPVDGGRPHGWFSAP